MKKYENILQKCECDSVGRFVGVREGLDKTQTFEWALKKFFGKSIQIYKTNKNMRIKSLQFLQD